MRQYALGNEHITRHQLTAWDEELDKNTPEAAQGIPCVALWSTTDKQIPDDLNPGQLKDVAINAQLQANMTERADGDVYHAWAVNDLVQYLYPFRNQVVYEIVRSPSGYRRVTPFLIVESEMPIGVDV
jgi:hypothetical protein